MSETKNQSRVEKLTIVLSSQEREKLTVYAQKLGIGLSVAVRILINQYAN